MKATWNGVLLAQSNLTIEIEGNHYFPPDSINGQFFQPSDTQSHCGWKGDASYQHIKVGDQLNEDAAWHYPEPLEAASQITGYVAFWKGVEVTS